MATELILDAVVTLIGRGGLAAVSMRAVSLEVGVSLGLMNYYAEPDFAEINQAAQVRYRSGLGEHIAAARPDLDADDVAQRAADILVIQNGVWLTSILITDRPAIERSILACESIALGDELRGESVSVLPSTPMIWPEMWRPSSLHRNTMSRRSPPVRRSTASTSRSRRSAARRPDRDPPRWHGRR